MRYTVKGIIFAWKYSLINMRYRASFFCFSILILFSCRPENKKGSEIRKAHGNVYYGGVFRINEIEDFRNLFPLSITETTSSQIATQIYEGLVKLSAADLSIGPCLAEKWEMNDSGTVYTFHLRKGVKFRDDPCFAGSEGRELTASDVKYCFDKVCEAKADNQGFWIFKGKVAGADEYYQSTEKKSPLKSGVSGIRILDQYTLQVRLLHPFAGFLNMLSTPFAFIYPKEAYDKYGDEMRTKAVGTGPFLITELKEGEAVILNRNENYWGVDTLGNRLPYLEAIKFSFIKEKKSELMEFRKGNLDMVHQLPLEMIDEVIGGLEEAKSEYSKFKLSVQPSMAIQYYGFQHKGQIFNNKLVRQAFNYAIDRRKIVDYTLQGEGLPAVNGIVPPSFHKYKTSEVKGYDFDPGKAKKLLSDAGFPNGKNFPKLSLQMNSGGTRNTQVAEVVQKMLKENLNIEISFEILPFAQHLENLEVGRAQLWRAAWVADYPDPENFLNLLYGEYVPKNMTEKSYLNSIRYRNARFDSIFAKALREINLETRYELLKKADQIAMDDAAIMPIFYDEYTNLVQKHVQNYQTNAMNFQDLRAVYFVPAGKEARP
jgi:oligopeptide transport system substrate-binding protein